MSRYEVNVGTTATKDFADVILLCDSGSKARLDVDYSPIRKRWRQVRPTALDFFLIASCIYAIDKLQSRDLAVDTWTRSIELVVPVSNPTLWEAQGALLDETVSFLTGDLWHFEFKRRTRALNPTPKGWRKKFPPLAGKAVSLFSGGVDSLTGVIDWLEEHPNHRMLLVGHHDPSIGGPKSDQDKVAQALDHYYPCRTSLVQIAVGQNPVGLDINFRSRSIIFLAIGALVASTQPDETPLLVPENGTMSLNVPLTPARRGSCSTRTTHPTFLFGIQKLWNNIGLRIPIQAPLAQKTKGECIATCLNQDLLRATIGLTCSCAKRARKGDWERTSVQVNGVRKPVTHCGRCIPCIFRRAALHFWNADDEDYGCDVCSGEVGLEDEQSASDLRAIIAFLSSKYSEDQIVQLLIANGRIQFNQLIQHANVVARAAREVAQLFTDKGTNEIKLQAGLLN